MSTSATIKVEGFDNAKVYKHYDGYPEGTLPFLQAFNEEFHAARGDDPNYKIAQLLRATAFRAKEFELDESNHTGWGLVDTDDDCGEEFEYTLKKDGTVSWKEVPFD